MRFFIVRRLGLALLTVFGVGTLIFFLQRLAGDPTVLLVPETATQADIDTLRHTLGLDRPLYVQYLSFLWDMLQLRLGDSLVRHVPVTSIIAVHAGYTLLLAAGALTVAAGLGIPLGAYLALRPRHRVARVLYGLVMAAQSMPTFWSGILLILLFGVTLQWLPPSSAGGFSHLIMPSISLGLLSMATLARVTRTAVINEFGRPYIRAALARGSSMWQLAKWHLARNAAIPVITIAALEISNLLAGAVIVETVFAWPGLGQLTVQAILARDFPIVQGVVLLGAFVTIGLNLLADVLYGIVDPRIRHGEPR